MGFNKRRMESERVAAAAKEAAARRALGPQILADAKHLIATWECAATGAHADAMRGGHYRRPVFRPIAKGGRLQATRLTDRSVAKIIKVHAARAGLDPGKFGRAFIALRLSHIGRRSRCFYF